MTPSPSVHAAATTLAGWARDRRSGWSDIPIEIPTIAAMPATAALVELVEPVAFEPMFEPTFEPVIEEAVEFDAFEDPIVEVTEDLVARPSVFVDAMAGLKDLIERLEPLGELVADWPEWLMRGAAVVSTMSVVMFIGVNRGEVSARWIG